MGKFHGPVGFATTVETSPGVYEPSIIEREYTGDILRERLDSSLGERANPDFILNNRLSIVGDSFALDNLPNIRYVEWRGVKWSVTSVEIQDRRIILSLRGVYT